MGTLKREFLQLQSETHPDKAGSVDPNDALRKKYENRSIQLNNAYKTLTNPLLRSEYLLKLQGIDALSERNSLEDKMLLMEVLELREALMEVDSEEELIRLNEENDTKIQESEDTLQQAFANNDLETAKNETIKLSYWQSMKQQISELRDKHL
jgi:molecular chaperone HscB